MRSERRSMEKTAIKMPRLTNNDDVVSLQKWYVKNGAFVEKGQPIAGLETAKKAEDLLAETAGYILWTVLEGDEAAVGETIAVLSQTPIADVGLEEKKPQGCSEPGTRSVLITKKAQALIEQYQIDIKSLPSKRVIREKDILAMVEGKQPQQSNANALLIVCGGNIARMCIDTVRQMGGYRLAGFTDIYAKPGDKLMGVSCIGDIDALDEMGRKGCKTAVNAFGGLVSSNSDPLFFARKELYLAIKEKGFFMPNLIHPKASVEASATMGEGNLIFSGAYVGSEAIVGDNCIINTGAIVSHNCKIGSHCRLSPGAVLAGDVCIGENSIIGMGVTIYMGVKIGENVIIYNGKDIFSDVPDNTIVR